MELLGRLLAAMEELHRNWDFEHQHRRETCQQVRNALIASNRKAFRAAVDEMDDETAAVFKRRLERSAGLTDTSRDKLMAVLREEYYSLFVEVRVEPWLDKTILWITRESVARLEADIKEMVEIILPANSNAIGEAAEKGDLSENAEWQFAIEEQRRLHGQLAQMQDDMTLGRILEPQDIATDSVGVGARVTLRKSDGAQVDATFLGPYESDVSKRIYNYRTPLAQSLMGKNAGETVIVKLDGTESEYTIERIEPGI